MSRSSRDDLNKTTIWDDLSSSPSAPTSDDDGVVLTEGTKDTHTTYGAFSFKRTTGSGTISLSDIAVYVRMATDDWYRVVDKDGNDIISAVSFDESQGVIVKVEHLGAMAEEIQIVADTGFANGITLEYWPITEDHRMSGGK